MALPPPGGPDGSSTGERISENGGDGCSQRPASEALKSLQGRLGELYEYFSYLLAVKSDAFKVRIRNTAILAALGVLAGVAAVGLVCAFSVVLTVFFLRGAAGGLGALFGGRPWLGELVLGAIFLGALGAGGGYFWVRFRKSSLRKLRARYEARKARQRASFGRSVSEGTVSGGAASHEG